MLTVCGRSWLGKLVNLPAILIVFNIFLLLASMLNNVCVISEKISGLPHKKGLEIPRLQGGCALRPKKFKIHTKLFNWNFQRSEGAF